MTYDERYQAASKFSISELDMMKQNGVFDELYNEEPEPAIDTLNFDMDTYQQKSLELTYFNWETVDEYG